MESIDKRSLLSSSILPTITACLVCFASSGNAALARTSGSVVEGMPKLEIAVSKSRQLKAVDGKSNKKTERSGSEKTSEDRKTEDESSTILENVNSIYVVDYDKVCLEHAGFKHQL